MSSLASLASGYSCPKSESKCGTELFLTLVNTRVHQHQKDQLCILRSTNLAGQCCPAAGPCGRCSKHAKGVPHFSSLRSQEFSQSQKQPPCCLGSLECPCHGLLLLGSACHCLSPGAQCLLLPQDIPAGLCSWELLYAGHFQASFYQVRNMFLMSY